MTDDAAGFGYDPTTREPYPQEKPRFAASLPPAFSVTSSWLPPVGQQGTASSPGYPGSCAAWATTYGLATFTAAKAGSINPSAASGQASPAYAYVQVLKEAGAEAATCGGSTFKPYFDMLHAQGAPTMQTAPYVADCATLWDDYANDDPAFDTAFRIGGIKSVGIADLDSVRQVLASNRALAYGTRLYTDWASYRGDPVPYVGSGTVIIGKNGKPAGHCMLIIGYDDTIGTGAVKIQNSQGTGWGSAGCVWMAYATFQALAQGQAFYVND